MGPEETDAGSDKAGAGREGAAICRACGRPGATYRRMMPCWRRGPGAVELSWAHVPWCAACAAAEGDSHCREVPGTLAGPPGDEKRVP